MIEVAFVENFAFGGVSIGIRREASGGHIYATGFDANNGQLAWKFRSFDEYLTETVPGINLEEEVLLALYQALVKRYQGAEDTRTIRADLLHERGRVDKLIDVVTTIAKEATCPE